MVRLECITVDWAHPGRRLRPDRAQPLAPRGGIARPRARRASVRIASLWDDQEEARFVGEEIEAEQRAGRALNDIAVLVRAGFQTRAFEERLTISVCLTI